MAEKVGEIALDLVVNQKQFHRQLQGISSLAKKTGAVLAAAFSVKKIVEFGKSCTKLGSELREVQNVVDVTFPHMTAQVDKFAKSAAAGFGLSETMAKRYTSMFGTMARQFGFSEKAAYDMGTTLAGLAGDVASFYDMTQDEAYTKLKAVFSGETEVLKDIGIVMTQSALDAYALANGYGKTTKAMSEMEKVALRYAFVQNQLSAASGDFIRTSDSWANQVRILKLNFESLKATIGQGLINVLTPVLKVINSILAKLMTLASAFKSFTELITGKKADAGGSTKATVAGIAETTGAVDSLADSTAGAGEAAKKAAKEMRSLMGFDQINKLSEPAEDDNASSGSSGGGISPGGVDFGSLAEGETVVEKLDSRMQSLIGRCKELAALFKNGFIISFGDSEKRLASIQKHINGIGKSIKDIFTDKSVIKSINTFFDSVALNVGKIAGSMAGVGITIADNLLGGIDEYLQGSKKYIKKRLIGIFDVRSEILNLIGEFSTAFSDVFSVFSGESAKKCTASIIGIFADSFLGIVDIAGRYSLDIINIITKPFIENKDAIKEAIGNTLEPIAVVLGTIYEIVKYVFGEMNRVYQEHISPMFQSFAKGWSEICGTLISGYNEYISPVLDKYGKKFKEVWQEHIKPAIDKALEFISKLSDAVKRIWEEVLQPFINWIAKNIFPIVAPILEKISDKFLDGIAVISDGIGLIFDVLGNVIDFLEGCFTGDWKKAWNSIKDIFKNVWETFGGLIKKPINQIIGFLNGLISAVASCVNSVARMLNNLNIDAPDWVTDLTGITSIGFNLPTWKPGRIPYLAQGGYVKPNTPQLAMIGDNRHQGEIVAPEGKLQEMVNAAVRAAGANGGVTKEEMELIMNRAVLRLAELLEGIGFYVDGEELAKAVERGKAKRDKRFNFT